MFTPHIPSSTHQVSNHPSLLENLPLYSQDLVLQESIQKWGTNHQEHLQESAALFGALETQEWGVQANQNPPQLHRYNRYGHRVDRVDFHPAYHKLMELGIKQGVSNIAWNHPEQGHFAHASLLYLLTQVEAGVCCPLSMSYAGLPVLQGTHNTADFNPFVEGLKSNQYDARYQPADQKQGLTMGMAMTEKQGGSDVKANQTQAQLQSDGTFLLTGHKWFCSAPMSDAFLTLAHTPEGLTCFFVPRWSPDGTRNRILVQRLKDKLGNRSNASSEIEYDHAWAKRVGLPGQGVKTIIEMVHHTRLDSALANAGMMRQAVFQATHHCRGRKAFGAYLIDQPLMQSVLIDLLIESEASTLLTLRLAHAFDQAMSNPQHRLFARLATALTKYWVCKRTPGLIYEALECHGGAGYIEESPMPRLYREAPLNSIWEGSGNVICLDILRAIHRQPESAQLLFEELEKGRGGHPNLDRHLDDLHQRVPHLVKQVHSDPLAIQRQARQIGADLAQALQARLLMQYGSQAVAEAFCSIRLGSQSHRVYGDFTPSFDLHPLLNRLPQS